ncbi:MAG: FimV/HubP family polar landmark protein, partial [Pseudomonadota bacterium]
MLAVLFVFLPATGHALGLGKLKVHSSLYQPLNAEIDFTSLTEAELKGLTVGLASRADFTAAGVERAAFLAKIKFSVNRSADGRYTLRFSTPTPIEEPFLHLLLQLDWPGGRLVREYTALIDPPFQIAAKAPAVEPPRAAAPTLTPAPKPEPAPATTVPVQSDPARATSPVAVTEALPYAPPASDDVALSSDGWPLEPGEAPAVKPTTTKTTAKGRIGPAPSWARTASHATKRGETLWSITKQVRSDPQVSIEQAALAIYRQNRDAFYDNNLNNIRAGKILRLPARENVEALSKEQARGAFQAQFDAWQEYKLRLAKAKRTIAVDEPAEAEDKLATDKKPVADAAATKKAAPAAKGQRSDELLKIVRSNLRGEKGADGRTTTEPVKGGEREQVALAERAETLEESLVSKQIEQKELSEKISQVRSQLKRESRLIELESQSLAPAPKPEAPKAEAPKAEPAKVEPVKVEPPKVAEPPKTEAPKVEAPKLEAKPKADAPQPAPKKGLPPPP